MKERAFQLESFSSADLTDGRQVVKVSPGGTKILAYVENGKITRYEAEDSAANPRPVLLVKALTPDAPEKLSSASFELPLSGIWDWVCVLDDVMMYCVHDSAGPGFFPPETTTTVVTS
jgi:hypothetical protein